MGTIEKKKERGAGMAFLQSLLREVPSTLFSLCWPCRAGRIKGWILREIQSALKELWQSM
jgi:hypothetical protein